VIAARAGQSVSATNRVNRFEGNLIFAKVRRLALRLTMSQLP